jgi:hypothetical protein
MSVKRTIIVPAILTLSTAGSIVAGTAASVAISSASPAASTTVVAMAPAYLYRG